LYSTGGTNHAFSKEEQVGKATLGQHVNAGIQPALRENARGTSQEQAPLIGGNSGKPQAPLISNDDQKKHLAGAAVAVAVAVAVVVVVGVAVVVVVVDGVGAVVAVGVGVVVAVVVAVAVVDVVGLVLTHKRRFSK
jgi:Flp pilus assembly protein TadB